MTGNNRSKNDPAEIDFRFADAETLASIMNVGVRRALAEHRRIGNAVAVWDHDRGEVRILPPEEIPADDGREGESASTPDHHRRTV